MILENYYENEYYSDSITQFFYARLLTAKALLLTKKYESNKQKGILDGFNQYFVLEEGFNLDIYKKFAGTQNLRQEVDYNARDYITKELAKNKWMNVRNSSQNVINIFD